MSDTTKLLKRMWLNFWFEPFGPPCKQSHGEGPLGNWGYDEYDHWDGPGHSST